MFRLAANRVRTYDGSAHSWPTRTYYWMNGTRFCMGMGSNGNNYSQYGGINDSSFHPCIGFCLGTAFQAHYTGDSLETAVEQSDFKSTYSVGDIFDLDLGTEGIVCAQLIAYDHDEKTDGSGKAAATFLTWYAMNNKYAVGSSNYPTSALHDVLNTTIKSKMPAAVSSRIVEVTKVWNSTGLSNGEQEYADSVWLVGNEKTLSDSINGSLTRTSSSGTNAYSCVARDVYASDYYTNFYGSTYTKASDQAISSLDSALICK